ncbi:hypothetical protein [Nitrincola sp.]|uniref:hypothetical protein n=1 Tax=Nitrincola sp. TaxID=1926584 RepID=UPI003A92B042
MANSFAYFSIAVWPIFIIIFFKIFELRKAIIISVFVSYLFLPASFEINFPGIPAFNKNTTTTVLLFIILVFFKDGLGLNELNIKAKFILFLYVISAFVTATQNDTAYLHLPAISLYDGLSQSVGKFLIFIPFLIGAKYFNRFEDQKLLFKSLVVACIVYLPFMLYEIRMSPQLHTMLYGFFPHSFAQQMRADGFRPVVFLGHGLLVAFFVSICSIAMYSIIRSKLKIFKINNFLLMFSFVVVLIMTKTYSALIYFSLAFLTLTFFKPRMIGVVSLLVVAIYIAYPVLSANNAFPHESIVKVVENVDNDRAQSLDFRFYHEGKLLFHANQKPFFGWGSWGRNRVYDPETFEDLSVTDGRWIIVLGISGWFGFLTEFFFIFISIILAVKVIRKENIISSEERAFLTGHLFMVLVILIDQIPNASLNYFYWFIVGGLYGISKRKLECFYSSNQ